VKNNNLTDFSGQIFAETLYYRDMLLKKGFIYIHLEGIAKIPEYLKELKTKNVAPIPPNDQILSSDRNNNQNYFFSQNIKNKESFKYDYMRKCW